MKPWGRRQINQLCLELGDREVIPQAFSDEEPTPLIYGQEGEAGSTGLLTHHNHRHRLSGIIFGQVPMQWGDFETNNATFLTRLKRRNALFGSVTLTNDQPGPLGAFGFDAVNFATLGAGGNGHICYSQSTNDPTQGVSTDRLHSPQRLRHWHCRARARQSVGVPNNHKAAIGGIHETVLNDIDSIDDALCFYIERNAAGVGNFRALARSSTTGLSTDTDLGIGWTVSTNGEFMSFEILYDLTTATFAIDGVILAEITENIPDLKLFGWGLFAEKTAAASNTAELWVDDFIFLGRT